MTFKTLLHSLVEVILPRHCVVCGRTLAPGEEHICLYCLADFPETFYWLRETNPMADRLNLRIQKLLEADPAPSHEPYARAAALFFYEADSPYSNITKSLKYHGDIPSGRYFSEMLGRRLASSALYRDVDFVVPVPLHGIRRLRRGYNQSDIIASAIAAALPSHPSMSPRLLVRKRRTRSQTTLSSDRKMSNVHGAFSADDSLAATLTPVHILLVDDVFTSGATMSECHRALRDAFGPSVRISVATLACVK